MGCDAFAKARHIGAKEFAFVLVQVMGELHEIFFQHHGHIDTAAPPCLQADKGNEDIVSDALDFRKQAFPRVYNIIDFQCLPALTFS